MRIAVITGASSGMGREFVRRIDHSDTFDEIWVIARRRDRLEALAAETKAVLRILAMDLTDSESIEQYKSLLEEKSPTWRCWSTAAASAVSVLSWTIRLRITVT